ncbi:MAG: pyridoxal phosphate-dependent aminotransferase [Deltaproteobacteria bacterium]|nr:MAG: pyridoxal phosphate-dependent aminotransferase [Deltaproteobacteria bacterium]RLB22634.1 MAG: pyridoxal phosphate-dependent aminotransferase [Deltaproteobacteria bacterium]
MYDNSTHQGLEKKITKRALDIQPFIVMDVMEKALELQKQGHHIVHLEIGEPDLPTPQCICKSGCLAMEKGYTHYTHSLGILELRQAICNHYQEKYGVEVTPDQVLVTSGTSPALLLIFSALLETGDQIIMSDPHYPCYPNYVNFLGAEPVFIKVYEEEGFQLDPDEIRRHLSPKVKAILINSPSNPTGTLLSPEKMKAIARLGVPVISDEIYHGLVYGEKEHSILEFTKDAFVLNGFSKLYAMTGWRLGYVIAPHAFVRPLQKMQQNFIISASSISQWAAITALKEAHEDVRRMWNTYNERRKYMVSRLKDLGFGLATEPQGAFYVFANAKHLSSKSYELAFEILEKAHVGVAPGIDFGENGEGYLRFSYANSLENIREGLDRIENYLRQR